MAGALLRPRCRKGSIVFSQEIRPARGIDPSKGLFRTTLAGEGHTLHDAFANLECAPRVERVVRHSARNMFGARVAVNDAEGRGYWDFMRARDDMYVIVENYSFKDPRVERIADDGILQFYFELSGDLTMTIPGAKTLHLNHPSLLIYHQQRGMEFTAWTAPSARQRSVIVNVRPQFLLDTFLGDGDGIPVPLQTLLTGWTNGAMPYCRLPLSAHMFDLVTRLVEAPYPGVIGLVNTEALVMELLCAGVAQVGLHSVAPRESYSPRELRCLYAAREILMKEMAQPPTIRDVARAAGLNQTTLKQGFKAVFGDTPFELSVRCRMQRALELLREERVPVSRVAEAVGYRHPTSFATAFRRHFGIQPQQAVRQRRHAGHNNS
jgi:AraC-like DNA-binding protein